MKKPHVKSNKPTVTNQEKALGAASLTDREWLRQQYPRAKGEPKSALQVAHEARLGIKL